MAKKAKSAPKTSPKTTPKVAKRTGKKAGKKADSKPVKKAKGSSSSVKSAPKKSASKAAPAPKKAVAPAVKPVKAKEPAAKEKVARKPQAAKPSVLKAVKPAPVAEEAELFGEVEAVKEIEAPEVAVEAAKVIPEKKVKKRDELKIDRTGDLGQQWRTLFEKNKGIKALPYKMSENYEAKTPLMHKVLGWGYVLTSQNDRLEVLFEDGIKILIANYKSS